MNSEEGFNPEMTIDEAFNPETIMDEVIDPEIVTADSGSPNSKRIGIIGASSNSNHLSKITAMLGASLAGMNVDVIDHLYPGFGKLLQPRRHENEKKCIHPNCNNMTSHKRGYCSKECLNDHKIISKRGNND